MTKTFTTDQKNMWSNGKDTHVIDDREIAIRIRT